MDSALQSISGWHSLPDGRRRIHGRLCTVRRIDKPTAAEFLGAFHLYGDAACRYRYGLYYQDVLVAVGTFSSRRRIVRDGRDVVSCEWVRYATASGLQVMGGMGKVLGAFIREVAPDDVMTYVPLDSYSGSAYRALGFVLESGKTFDGHLSAKFRRVFR